MRKFFTNVHDDGITLREPSALLDWAMKQYYNEMGMQLQMSTVNIDIHVTERVYAVTVPYYTKEFGYLRPSIYITNRELSEGYPTSLVWDRLDYELFNMYIDRKTISTQFLTPAEED